MPKHTFSILLFVGVLAAGSLSPSPSDAETTELIVGGSLPQATSSAPPTEPTRLRWLPSRGRECNERGKYKHFCAGPRRAPLPFGPEAELAKRLGLGETKTVSHALLQRPKPEWIEAAGPIAVKEPLWPVPSGKFWRGFGRTRTRARGNHDGVDIGAKVGTPIVSVQDGLVIYSDNGIRGYGNLLITAHSDGTVAFYAHCRALYVFPGQRVERGQIVGEVGTTGYARGPHLHFELRKNGRLRDPMKSLVREESGQS